MFERFFFRSFCFGKYEKIDFFIKVARIYFFIMCGRISVLREYKRKLYFFRECVRVSVLREYKKIQDFFNKMCQKLYFKRIYQIF